ncbi:MAG: RHS repeat-associated core domain-containing protein, partial [Anaerovoracaceae bacterium]
ERRTTNTKVPRVYYFYNKDLRASTTSVIAESGAAVKAYKYDEFGNTVSFGNLDNEVAYTGGIYDKSNRLYYLNARYYNPEDGRFITQDSYRGTNSDIGTWHLYAYCGNNPVIYVDPSGHSKAPVYKGKLGKGLKLIPSKGTHYGRNKYNTNLPETIKKAKEKGWKNQPSYKSACHQFSAPPGKANYKFLSPTGKKEVVYRYSKKAGRYIVTASPRDLGTYNFGVDTWNHTWKDLVPYLYWGNSTADFTTQKQRVSEASKGYALGLAKKALKIIKKWGW